MRVGRYVLPRNSLNAGEGAHTRRKAHGIGIIQVEHDGIIIPVELAVYDNDGQEGIFIPGSMEANAAKEVAANLGQNSSLEHIHHQPVSQGASCSPNSAEGCHTGCRNTISEDAGRKSTPQIGYTLMLYQENDNQ